MRSISILGIFLAICIVACAREIPTAEDVDMENLRKLALANNEFAFNLHRRLASGSSRNVFFSPLSISTALGMLLYGTRGKTAEELRKVLGYDKVELLNNAVHDTFHNYFNEVLKSGNSSDGYLLSSANAILADRNLELLEEYKRNVQELYKAAVYNVDFSEDSSKIVNQISQWVREKTNGKIEKLIDELSSDTLSVLLNAVYFKGIWKTQFNPKRTFDSYFYNNGLHSESKVVPMMRITSEFPVAYTEDFKAWELPYKGENISMLILLPENLDGLPAFEESMTSEKLAKIQEQMTITKVSFTLPKFKLEFKEELTRPLQALGVNRIFNAEADFSGMTPSRGMIVSQVLHKAVIEVNEEGSEAAAATAVVSKFRSGFIPFMINHPFLFAIVEKSSKKNMILFMGRVNNL